jgi:hypothetical protein
MNNIPQKLASMGFTKGADNVWRRGSSAISEDFFEHFTDEALEGFLKATDRREKEDLRGDYENRRKNNPE